MVGRCRIRTCDFHRVKVALKKRSIDGKGVKSRKSAKPAKSAIFATNFSNYSPQWAKGLILQRQSKF
jgi:hypothetical protein